MRKAKFINSTTIELAPVSILTDTGFTVNPIVGYKDLDEGTIPTVNPYETLTFTYRNTTSKIIVDYVIIPDSRTPIKKREDYYNNSMISYNGELKSRRDLLFIGQNYSRTNSVKDAEITSLITIDNLKAHTLYPDL